MNLRCRPICVWFDLDDTLISTSDSMRAAVTASTSYLKAFDQDLTERVVARASMDVWHTEFGPGTAGFAQPSTMDLQCVRDRIINGTIKRLGLSGVDLAAHCKHSAFAEENAWMCFRGVQDLLAALKGLKITTGLISNGPTGLQYKKLRSCELLDRFDHIVLDCEVGSSKPNRKIFESAVERVPDCVNILVGNDPDADIDGALKAKWKAIWYKPGWWAETKPQESGYISIQHHSQLLDFLPQGQIC